jgi:hypothetical protein
VDAIVTEDEEVASGTAVLFIFVVIPRSAVAQRCGEDRTLIMVEEKKEERRGCRHPIKREEC